MELQAGFNPRDSRKEWVQSTKSFSWQDYVTVVLAESGHVAKASIQRLKDGAVWASSKGFCLSKEEVTAIKEGFLDDTTIRQEGLVLNNTRYTLTRVSGLRVMVGRRTRTGEGCVLYLCGTCLLCGLYSDHNHPGQCYAIITQLGDYLVEKGF